MKICAVVISGQPRNVEKGYKYIKENILDLNPHDVFIHTWWDETQVGQPFINTGGHVASEAIQPNTPEMIMDLYNPIFHIFERQRTFDEKNYEDRKFSGINVFYSISQLYSIAAANSLKLRSEANHLRRKYDTVIRIRFDWGITTPIIIEKYNLDYLYLPSDCPHHHGYNDQFSISSSSDADVYSSLYYDLDNIFTQHPTVPFVNETLLYQHLTNCGVAVAPIHIPYTILKI